MARRARVTLDDDLYARAERRAAALGVSVDEYLRSLIADALPEKKQRRRGDISAIFGLGNSGGTNIAKDKHRLIAEAIAADKLK
ncbi:MAG: hypothetical protein H6509_14465 [Bryobacterales bacterium]|nr:hypothetical protein [Acidobacteriota bacterium]MCB9385815.1 hypothetical protein [Bryobacterales bacterium]